jgi:hypothetical protein
VKPPERWPTPPATPAERAFREHREDLNRRLRLALLLGAEAMRRALVTYRREVGDDGVSARSWWSHSPSPYPGA